MGRKSVLKVPAFVDCLVTVGTKHLVESALTTADEARSAMHAIAVPVSQQFACIALYVPVKNPRCGGTAPWLVPGTSELVGEFFEFLVVAGIKHLKAAAIGQAPQRHAVMQAIAGHIFWCYEKQILYVPANKELALQARDQQILGDYGQDGPGGESRFTAKRLQQIARQHGIGIGHAYNILKNLAAQRKRLAGAGGSADGPGGVANCPPANPPANHANQDAATECA